MSVDMIQPPATTAHRLHVNNPNDLMAELVAPLPLFNLSIPVHTDLFPVYVQPPLLINTNHALTHSYINTAPWPPPPCTPPPKYTPAHIVPVTFIHTI